VKVISGMGSPTLYW